MKAFSNQSRVTDVILTFLVFSVIGCIFMENYLDNPTTRHFSAKTQSLAKEVRGMTILNGGWIDVGFTAVSPPAAALNLTLPVSRWLFIIGVIRHLLHPHHGGFDASLELWVGAVHRAAGGRDFLQGHALTDGWQQAVPGIAALCADRDLPQLFLSTLQRS